MRVKNISYLIQNRSYKKLWSQKIRAESRTRTGDLLITNELLYQLSYFGIERQVLASRFAKVVK